MFCCTQIGSCLDDVIMPGSAVGDNVLVVTSLLSSYWICSVDILLQTAVNVTMLNKLNNY